jgi:diguanylate cyclase (GGDEF)-like protein
MDDELAKHGGRSVALPKSPAFDAANSDDLSQSRPFGKRAYRAALKQNRQLLRECSQLREEVSLLQESLKMASRRADYDALTGLVNRPLLLERFTQASALGKRHQQHLALLFLDLDKFKNVNDKLGHEAGDQLLQQFAARLSACIRATDTASRYGGDEFVVLLTEIDCRDAVITSTDRILAHLGPPYIVDGKSIRMPVSFGIAIYPDDGVEYTELMRHSDRSMYRNKALKTHRRRPRTTTRPIQA